MLELVLPISNSPVVGKSSRWTGLGFTASCWLLLFIFCSNALSIVLNVFPLTKIPGGFSITAK